MKNMDNRYQILQPNIIHEMIDGEVVIVNLKKGHYYSVFNTGAHIWNDIVKGYAKSMKYPVAVGEINHSTNADYIVITKQGVHFRKGVSDGEYSFYPTRFDLLLFGTRLRRELCRRRVWSAY